MLAILVGLIIGTWEPVQTSMNSRLKIALGSPYLSSLFSFGTGAVILGIANLAIYHTLNLFPNQLFMSQPLWFWLGGVFGAIYVTSNILLFPNLGSVQTAIMPILGQILMGLIIDNFALFGSLHRPLTFIKALGATLVILGVVGAVTLNRQRQKNNDRSKSKSLIFWRLLGIIAGMFSAMQTAINGHVGTVTGSLTKSAFLSFLGGSITLLIVLLLIRPPFKYQKAKKGNPWWMWTSDIIAILCVLGNAYIVPILGTGLAVIIILVGVISGSLLIDKLGLLASKKRPVTVFQVLSLLVMISGVILIRIF